MKNKLKTVLFVIWILFIWSRSMRTAAQSSVESVTTTSIVNYLMMIFGATLTEHIVRKAAHFVEFALLGFLGISAINRFSVTAAICLTVGSIDEIIQRFFPGRSCQFSDVVLDFVGALAGIITYYFLRFIMTKVKRKFSSGNRG